MVAWSMWRERPKSPILIRQSAVTSRFADFRSRWMMPERCRKFRPVAASRAMSTRRSTGRSMRSSCRTPSSDPRSANSVTMCQSGVWWLAPRNWMICGCRSSLSSEISSQKVWSAKAAFSRLTAHGVPRQLALITAPDEPMPIFSPIDNSEKGITAPLDEKSTTWDSSGPQPPDSQSLLSRGKLCRLRVSGVTRSSRPDVSSRVAALCAARLRRQHSQTFKKMIPASTAARTIIAAINLWSGLGLQPRNVYGWPPAMQRVVLASPSYPSEHVAETFRLPLLRSKLVLVSETS